MVEATSRPLADRALRERILKAISGDPGQGGQSPGETGSDLVFIRFQGTSMQPGLREGDVLVAVPLNGSPPGRGEIVLRPRDEHVYEAHRVLECAGGRVVTRGDSRPFRDGAWPVAQCRGRVVAVWRGNALLQPPARPSAWVRLSALTRLIGGTLIGGTLVRNVSFLRRGVKPRPTKTEALRKGERPYKSRASSFSL